MDPLVSICVPVYGVEQHIEKCCQSLFEQSYKNIEYIFVDDCTPDGSIQVINKVLEDYPQRKDSVKIIHHECNKGLSAARNTALSATTGHYVMPVDSDDYLDLDVVEKLVKKAQIENADVVLYDMRYVYPNRQFIVKQYVPDNHLDCIKDTLTYKMIVCVCGGLYEAGLFKNTGIRFVEGLNFGEDYVVKPRLLYYARKVVRCEGCLYNYVQYNTSSYTLSYRPKNIDDLIKAMDILDGFFEQKEDYLMYKDALVQAHWHVKVKLLIAICLHMSSVGDNLQMVSKLYDGLDKPHNMSFTYRIVLWLANHGWHKMLIFYVNWGLKLKRILKRL